MFVEPAAMRRGVGAALMRAVCAEARARGAARLSILADPNAAAFYEACGARFVRDDPSDAVPGRTLPRYTLELAPQRSD
jgi:predicted N-acetyltransferase YhbS